MSHRTIAALLLLTPAVLFAGAENAEATARCRAFAVGRKPSVELYVKTGSRYEKLAVSTDFIGKSFRTGTKDGIVFYRKTPATKDKSEAYAPCAHCAPDGVGRQLIFFIPGEGESLNVIAKSDADGKFPPGTRLIVNISPNPVSLDFGGTKLTVNSRKTGLLGAPLKSREGVANIRISRQDKQGRWILFSSSSWLSDSIERKIVLIYPSGPDSLALTSVSDTPEAKDAEELGTRKKK